MKRIRKFLIRSFALVMLAMLVVGGVLGGFGYKMYRDALAEQPLDQKVAEIQADPNYTTLAEIPEIYLDAVVAVEDHRFEQHFGIDLIAIGRAAWNNLTSWSLREGGSTITQQLAKNMYFTQERSLIFGDVVVRVSPNYATVVHIDTDEANAANCKGEVFGEIVK